MRDFRATNFSNNRGSLNLRNGTIAKCQNPYHIYKLKREQPIALQLALLKYFNISLDNNIFNYDISCLSCLDKYLWRY